MEITLQDIMKEIMQIKARQDLQEKHQAPKRSESQNWRQSTPQRITTLLDSHMAIQFFCLTKHTWYEYLETLGMNILQASVSLLLQPSLACFQHVEVHVI